jgi:hypothetical protein
MLGAERLFTEAVSYRAVICRQGTLEPRDSITLEDQPGR